MPASAPRLDELPDTFPVFPLAGALLLPGARLPLNIFEPRYLAMTDDALASGRMFAMTQPDQIQAETPAGPALYRVGCLGRLVSFSETEDGRYLITLVGLARFRLAEELPGLHGYRRARGDFTDFAADLGDTRAAQFDRPALLRALKKYFTRQEMQANWDAIDKMADNDLVTTLSMVCPFEPPAKQALLEAPTPTERAETLLTLLEIDSHAPPGDADEHAPGHIRAS